MEIKLSGPVWVSVSFTRLSIESVVLIIGARMPTSHEGDVASFLQFWKRSAIIIKQKTAINPFFISIYIIRTLKILKKLLVITKKAIIFLWLIDLWMITLKMFVECGTEIGWLWVMGYEL